MTAPAPTACRRCEGSRRNGRWACFECSCGECGQVTDTPPQCKDCGVAEETTAKRRADQP